MVEFLIITIQVPNFYIHYFNYLSLLLNLLVNLLIELLFIFYSNNQRIVDKVKVPSNIRYNIP